MSAPRGVAAVLTSFTRLAGARVAVRSWLAAHPEPADCTVCVIDDRFGEVGPATFGSDRVRMLAPAEMADAFPDREFARVVAALEGADREAAVRPMFLSIVLGRSPGCAVTSIPDDAWILREFVFTPPNGSVLAVVPRRITPVPRDGRLPDDVELAALGRVDQSLVSVGPDAAPLLAWWAAQVSRAPRIHLERMLPWRQPWLDDLLMRSDVHVVDDLTVGVAYWNADQHLPSEPSLLRFPGFDPNAPWRLTDAAGAWPRVLLSEHPALGLTAQSYARELLRAEHNVFSERRDGWSVLGTGAPLDAASRHAYLHALQHAEGTDGIEPPNPFLDGEQQFLGWLEQPDEIRKTSRYLAALSRTRADLSDLADDGLLHWSRHNAHTEVAVGRALADSHASIPSADVEPAEEAVALRPGISVIGLLRAELGMGEAARLTAQSVASSGVPYAVVVTSETVHRQDHPFESAHECGLTESNFDTDVVVLNADVMETRTPRPDRRTVGLWFWEVERFPLERYPTALTRVDEIWVASAHVLRAIAVAVAELDAREPGYPTASQPTTTRVPHVHLFPLASAPAPAVAPGTPTAIDGVSAGRFVFLFVFDFASVAERKNPWGLIDAFTEAFPEPSPYGPVLVLKTMSGDHYLDDRERLRGAAGARSDIILLEGFATAAEKAALMTRADCYVSLHRAEGWGLTLAEAMALGKPVIATGYSGNLEFMTDDNSWLIPYTLVPIPGAVRAYAGCGRWAEPDLHGAVLAMREVVADPRVARARGARAAVDLAERAASPAGAAFIRARFEAWNATPSPAGPQHPMTTAITTAMITTEAHMDSPTSDVSDPDAPMDAPMDAPPAAETAAWTDEIRPIEHHGIGPVVLPDQPPLPELPTGPRQRLGLGGDERMQQWRDRRDHERAVAIVHELTQTRAAVAEESKQRRRDDASLTGWFEGVRTHLDNLQGAHDTGMRSVAELSTRAAEQAQALLDLRNALADARSDLARIETRLAELTRALESNREVQG